MKEGKSFSGYRREGEEQKLFLSYEWNSAGWRKDRKADGHESGDRMEEEAVAVS